MNDSSIYVVFDLDDTLYPEREYVLSGFKAVSEWLSQRTEFTKSQLFKKLRRDFECGIRGDNFDRLLEETGITVDVETLIDLYRDHEPTIDLTPDAQCCLDKIEARPLGLITDGIERKQRRKIEALSIDNRFERIYISEQFAPNGMKPMPTMFEQFLEDTGWKPAQVVYVGDNPSKDFVAPNELGMQSILVQRPWGEYSENQAMVPAEKATEQVDSLCEIPKLVQRWEAKV